MPHENERVEFEMQIMNYRDLLGRVGNEDFHERTRTKIAELEQKLRKIDEYLNDHTAHLP